MEIIFPEKFPHPVFVVESHMNIYQDGRNRPRKKSLGYVCIILAIFIDF